MVTRRAVTCGLLAMVLSLALIETQTSYAASKSDTRSEIRAVLDAFFEAFNNADNAALQSFSHYPHVFHFNNGGMAIAEKPSDLTMNFEGMREREGWHRSTLDEVKFTRVSDTKAHVEIVFSRYHADGVRYRTVPALWILVKKDGRWGIQLRSLMPPTFP